MRRPPQPVAADFLKTSLFSTLLHTIFPEPIRFPIMKTEEKLLEIKKTARRVLPSFAEAWLFGSRARGTSHSESDWDILIILDKDKIEPDDFDKYSYPFFETGWEIGDPVIPIMYTKKGFEKISFTPFHKNVMNDRIKL